MPSSRRAADDHGNATQTTGEPAPRWRSERSRRPIAGAAFGVLAWFALASLLRGTVSTGPIWMLLVAAVVGSAIGALSERLLCGGAIATGGIVAAVAATPVTPWLVGGLLRSDPLVRADAIVALDGGRGPGGSPNAATHRRFMHALALYDEGWAPVLVVSVGQRPDGPSLERTIRLQLGHLADRSNVEVLPPGESTHDEALRTSELAAVRGWKSVLLVTDPLHMRRAAAAFAKMGLRVVRSPCDAPEYDPRRLDSMHQRVEAFRDWLHEVIGWQVYRWRGWL